MFVQCFTNSSAVKLYYLQPDAMKQIYVIAADLQFSKSSIIYKLAIGSYAPPILSTILVIIVSLIAFYRNEIYSHTGSNISPLYLFGFTFVDFLLKSLNLKN